MPKPAPSPIRTTAAATSTAAVIAAGVQSYREHLAILKAKGFTWPAAPPQK